MNLGRSDLAGVKTAERCHFQPTRSSPSASEAQQASDSCCQSLSRRALVCARCQNEIKSPLQFWSPPPARIFFSRAILLPVDTDCGLVSPPTPPADTRPCRMHMCTLFDFVAPERFSTSRRFFCLFVFFDDWKVTCSSKKLKLQSSEN